MTGQQVRVVHVHHHHKYKPKRRRLRVIRSLVLMLPFGETVIAVTRAGVAVVVLVALFVGWLVYWPGSNLPYVPFISCSDTRPVGGVVGASHRAGSALWDLQNDPPSVEDVQEFLAASARQMGKVAGTFISGVRGQAGPTEYVSTPAAEQAAGGCVCSPGGGDGTVRVSASTAGGPAVVAARAAAAAGFTGEDLVTAVAVAGVESSWQPSARNPSGAAGLWQILPSAHPEKFTGDWSDPVVNARMARAVWLEAGGSWRPWVAYTSNAYTRFMPQARAAVSSAGVGGGVVADPADCGPGNATPAVRTGRYRLPGVAPHVAAAADEVGSKFGIATIGGVGARAGASDHPSGHALDFMTRDGGQLAAYVQANARRLRVTYVIWDQRIWATARADEGWRRMADRGSATANHKDHVHVSFERTTAPA